MWKLEEISSVGLLSLACYKNLTRVPDMFLTYNYHVPNKAMTRPTKSGIQQSLNSRNYSRNYKTATKLGAQRTLNLIQFPTLNFWI